VISVVTALLFVVAVWDLVPDLGLDLVNHPGLAIRIGPDDAGLLRWAYLADMVGYYLLLVPVILALRVEDGSPAGDIGAVSGLAYVVLGGRGRPAGRHLPSADRGLRRGRAG
jgi:hypothetical protein